MPVRTPIGTVCLVDVSHASRGGTQLTARTLRRLGGVSVAPDTTVALQDRFASDLPEMAVSWQAQTFPDLRLLAFNAPLAGQLGLDPVWLKGPDGLRFLVGNLIPSGAAPVAQAYAGHQLRGEVSHV